MDLDYEEIMDYEEMKDYEDFIHHFLPHLLSIQSNIANYGLDCIDQEEENEILKYFNVSKKQYIEMGELFYEGVENIADDYIYC